jgi:predicted enzyme related to lactoylglutathione lyase
MSNPVIGFEVMGQDADKFSNFYGQLLGWKFNTENPVNDGMVDAGAGEIAGGVGQLDEGPGGATFYTKVSDLEAAVALAENLGASVRMPITDLPDTRLVS